MATTGSARPGLLRGVDHAAFAIALVARLRDHGLSTGLTAAEAFVAALQAQPPVTRTQLYWAARVSLVHRHTELGSFDEVFAAVFDDAVVPLDPNARRTSLPESSAADERLVAAPGGSGVAAGATVPWATLPAAVGTSDAVADDDDPLLPLRLPSAIATLVDAPFDRLSSDELRLLGQWLAIVARRWPSRPSRRTRPAASGRHVALRPTMAAARRTGWEPVRLVRSRQVRRPRRVVVLCDVSQSMRAHTAAYFHLMRALVRTGDAEAFAFGVGLTRLTPTLRHRSADVAIEQASARVADRFAGTRIATSVRALLASHHGELLRGAIVLIGSDGWDSDPPEQLAAAMVRLRRRAHRVVWMNPRAGSPGYRPDVRSMAAALPFCDEFLAADDFRALAAVVAALAGAGPISSRA